MSLVLTIIDLDPDVRRIKLVIVKPREFTSACSRFEFRLLVPSDFICLVIWIFPKSNLPFTILLQ